MGWGDDMEKEIKNLDDSTTNLERSVPEMEREVDQSIRSLDELLNVARSHGRSIELSRGDLQGPSAEIIMRRMAVSAFDPNLINDYVIFLENIGKSWLGVSEAFDYMPDKAAFFEYIRECTDFVDIRRKKLLSVHGKEEIIISPGLSFYPRIRQGDYAILYPVAYLTPYIGFGSVKGRIIVDPNLICEARVNEKKAKEILGVEIPNGEKVLLNYKIEKLSQS